MFRYADSHFAGCHIFAAAGFFRQYLISSLPLALTPVAIFAVAFRHIVSTISSIFQRHRQLSLFSCRF
jgi:hypothetical protein